MWLSGRFSGCGMVGEVNAKLWVSESQEMLSPGCVQGGMWRGVCTVSWQTIFMTCVYARNGSQQSGVT